MKTRPKGGALRRDAAPDRKAPGPYDINCRQRLRRVLRHGVAPGARVACPVRRLAGLRRREGLRIPVCGLPLGEHVAGDEDPSGQSQGSRTAW